MGSFLEPQRCRRSCDRRRTTSRRRRRRECHGGSVRAPWLFSTCRDEAADLVDRFGDIELAQLVEPSAQLGGVELLRDLARERSFPRRERGLNRDEVSQGGGFD